MSTKHEEYRDMINELLDYEAELTDTELFFLTTIKDYSEFTSIQFDKIDEIYDKVFGDNEQDTYEIFDEN